MTNRQITSADTAKGSRYWNRQERAGWATFYKTSGDANLQAVLDRINFYRSAARACTTYHPVNAQEMAA